MADDRLQIFSHDSELRSVPPINGNTESATLSGPADRRPADRSSELPVCRCLSPAQEDQSQVPYQSLPFFTSPSQPSASRPKRKPSADTWHGLSHDHKAILYATAARDLKFDRSITIRLFREHHLIATKARKSLQAWAVKQFQNAIRRACHSCPGVNQADVHYVFVIEPHRSYRTKLETQMYRWSPERAFDLHIALASGGVPDLWPALEEQLERGFRQRKPGQRQFQFQPISDERGGPRGWVLYCLKHADRTARDHDDVVPGRPWAVSHGVTDNARTRFETAVVDIGREGTLSVMTAGKQYEVELGRARRARERDQQQLRQQQTPA